MEGWSGAWLLDFSLVGIKRIARVLQSLEKEIYSHKLNYITDEELSNIISFLILLRFVKLVYIVDTIQQLPYPYFFL